jgi:alpha-amylase
MSNPWNGKAVLEVFWWNCWNTNYPHDWYTFVAKLAPRIAALGFDGIWTPPPCKDRLTDNTSPASNEMGYTPYDYYDLGLKNQIRSVYTRFGDQDSFLRLVAVAHANGLEVYPDIVLDHCASGDLDPSSPFEGTASEAYTLIQLKGFAGAGTGRWPRNWLDFHANPQHWNGTGDWVASNGGPDFCYQGRCTDSGAGDQNCAARANARAWFTWFVKQTGVDGFRFDDVKGFPPEVVEDLLYNAMGSGLEYFCVGEYVTGATSDVDAWVGATLNRSGTFDYPLRFALADLVAQNGYSDVGNLPSQQQENRFKTVPFVNNHDNYDGHVGSWIDADNPRTQLAYAVAMTVDGSPQFFYADLFRNVAPWVNGTTADAIPSRPWVENLVWCHQKLAFKSGDYFVRYQQSQQLLILERGARAIVAINNDGSAWHDAWISTAFAPGTQLHDYSGSRPDDIWTNQDAWVQIAVPPLSYSIWGPAGVTGGFSPASRRTVQQFEMDDDLGDSDAASPGYGGRVIPGTFRSGGAIWPAAATRVNVSVYSDAPQQIDLQVVRAGGTPVLQRSGSCTANVPLAASFMVAAEDRHVVQAKLSRAAAVAARIYIKVDYQGPATSTLF